MTLLEVKNQLVTHFFEHDTFEFKKHQLTAVFDKETVDFREAMYGLALEELTATGWVKKVTTQEREAWVLTRPIHHFVQHVEIGPVAAEAIATLINDVNQAQGLDVFCDKTKVTETDVLRLVEIVGEVADGHLEQEKN